MARRQGSSHRGTARVKRTAKKAATRTKGAIRSSVGKMTARVRGTRKKKEPARTPAAAAAQPKPRRSARPAAARPRRVEPDIPLDVLERTYTPTQTSLKAGFRSDGDDRERDQEFAAGFADDRWSDEDHYTNRSGDPRIGTHGRRFEGKPR